MLIYRSIVRGTLSAAVDLLCCSPDDPSMLSSWHSWGTMLWHSNGFGGHTAESPRAKAVVNKEE